MNKKLAVALSGSAVLALALSGCGDDGSEKRDKWAKTICDEMRPQFSKIQQANAAIADAAREKQPEKVKQTDSQAFQHISEAYAALADAVTKAGEPPVDDGAELQQDAVKELKGIATSYGELREAADALETDEEEKFYKGLKALAGKLEVLDGSSDKALTTLQEGELGQAMAKQESCKAPDATEGS